MNNTQPQAAEIQAWFESLQMKICRGLEAVDGQGIFQADAWQRAEGGGGLTCILQDGAVLAKGGVAFSAVHGLASAAMLHTLRLPALEAGADLPSFLATGVSIVLHPKNPQTPIIHMNVRYFELSNGHWWFGGGIDLTPHYIVPHLAKRFHERMKAVCDAHHAAYYERFKNWADEYFYLPHRQETRGIGGIFFDRLHSGTEPLSKAELWAFVQAVGEAFVPAYAEQVEATKELPFDEADLRWQALRRGRYVEFNLVWDRGTQFGLQTNGRTESILMSMPPQAQWQYCHEPLADSREAQTLAWLKKGMDWLGVGR